MNILPKTTPAGADSLVRKLRDRVYSEAIEEYASFCRTLLGSDNPADIISASGQKTIKEQFVSMLEPENSRLDDSVVAWCYEQGDNLLDALYSRCGTPDACLHNYIADVFTGIKAEMRQNRIMEETA